MNWKISGAGLVLLTGWRGVGKTGLLQKLVDAATQAGWAARGLITPARMDAGQKTGIYVVDVRSGDCRLLASSVAGELHGPATGSWFFDAAAFAWGNSVLKQTLPCDLFVLDELGPLEFDRQEGWMAGFDFLAIPSAYWLGIVVVRPEYVEAFLKRFPQASIVTVNDPGEIDPLVRQFSESYWE